MRPIAAGMALLLLGARSLAGLGIDVEARATAGVHLAKDARFEAGAQFALTAGGLVEVVSAIGLGGGVAASYESTSPSPVVDLVSYRGYRGVRLGVFAVWWLGALPVDLGVRLGITGAFLRYAPTYTFFVTPGVWLEPALAVALPALPWLNLGAVLPIVITRRADLALSLEISVALTVCVTLSPGGAP